MYQLQNFPPVYGVADSPKSEDPGDEHHLLHSHHLSGNLRLPAICNTTTAPSTSVGDSILTCPHCDCTFTSHISLVGHMRIHQGGDDPTLPATRFKPTSSRYNQQIIADKPSPNVAFDTNPGLRPQILASTADRLMKVQGALKRPSPSRSLSSFASLLWQLTEKKPAQHLSRRHRKLTIHPSSTAVSFAISLLVSNLLNHLYACPGPCCADRESVAHVDRVFNFASDYAIAASGRLDSVPTTVQVRERKESTVDASDSLEKENEKLRCNGLQHKVNRANAQPQSGKSAYSSSSILLLVLVGGGGSGKRSETVLHRMPPFDIRTPTKHEEG
ncbi:unnamed protein product [Schistocephalus solidus]|uniref:C2H2-type domain-containing protein n=1 Tax=Schistocephalus solidus TaxID=70667 RepID=A0A183SX39_SCHSO|nr:unnamed protein product [Schistocephalus solidus]